VEHLLGPVPRAPAAAGDGALVFARNPEPRGPMSVFGFDYFTERYGEAKAAALSIRKAQPLWGDGGYEYEVLNLVDGRRTAQEIRDTASAIYGPVELDAVLEYLRALAEIGVTTLSRP
jgi:aminopeptidase YwaD